MNLFEASAGERVEMEKPFLTCKSDLTPETRKYMYGARRGLLYIPQQGIHGGTMAKVARDCNCARNYVHMTLFPEDPSALFGSSPKQRAIWSAMAERVYANPFYEPIKAAFAELDETGMTTMKIKANYLKFFMKRAAELNYDLTIAEEVNTSPRTYVIVKRDQ